MIAVDQYPAWRTLLSFAVILSPILLVLVIGICSVVARGARAVGGAVVDRRDSWPDRRADEIARIHYEAMRAAQSLNEEADRVAEEMRREFEHYSKR